MQETREIEAAVIFAEFVGDAVIKFIEVSCMIFAGKKDTYPGMPFVVKAKGIA